MQTVSIKKQYTAQQYQDITDHEIDTKPVGWMSSVLISIDTSHQISGKKGKSKENDEQKQIHSRKCACQTEIKNHQKSKVFLHPFFLTP